MSSLEIGEIKKILPQAYPFLMVDRVLSIIEDEIVGLKNVTINEPFFQGHFPEEAIFPGVLQIEALAQLAAIKVIYERNLINKKNSIYFLTIDNVKFRKKVVPGDQLKLVVHAKRNNVSRLRFNGETFVNDELVCTVKIGAVIRQYN